MLSPSCRNRAAGSESYTRGDRTGAGLSVFANDPDDPVALALGSEFPRFDLLRRESHLAGERLDVLGYQLEELGMVLVLPITRFPLTEEHQSAPLLLERSNLRHVVGSRGSARKDYSTRGLRVLTEACFRAQSKRIHPATVAPAVNCS